MFVEWVGDLLFFTVNAMMVLLCISFIVGVIIGLIILFAFLINVIREAFSEDEEEDNNNEGV